LPNVITVSSNMSGEEFMETLDTLVADPSQLLGPGEFAAADDADEHEPSTEARLN
jgi:hypothetical protein